MSNKEKIVAVILLLLAFMSVGSMEHEDEVAHRAHYCENVRLWEADRNKGIPPKNRAGWPAKNEQDREQCMNGGNYEQ